MMELGFSRCAVDHAVFLFDKVTSGTCIICIVSFHVDDGLRTSNSPAFLASVKRTINGHFGIKDLGPVKKFLGIQFERDLVSHQL